MTRIDKLKTSMEGEGKYPFLFFDLNNIFYLTGFTGSSAYLIVDEEDTFFITDSRYEEYAQNLLAGSGIRFVLQKESIIVELGKLVSEKKWKKMYVEEHAIMLQNYNMMQDALQDLKLIGGGNPLEQLRVVKEATEIEMIKKAVDITDRCLAHLKTFIHKGIREWDIATEIVYFSRQQGATDVSFPSIVGSGRGSSMPHYETSMTKRLENGDPILIDMGCTYKRYNSDLTRTLFLDHIDEEMAKIYHTVNQARQTAIESIRPGITTGELDAVARTIISDAGYGEYFSHSLGHGVGLDVHEFPRVKTGDTFVLPAGCVFTIEPGVYIPGKGGVRIEDMVLVTDEGYEILTNSPREITVI